MRPLIFVMTSLAPTGGIERDAIKCLQALVEQGRTLYVIAANLHPDVPGMFPEGAVHWFPIQVMRRPLVLNNLWMWRRASTIINRLRHEHPDALVVAFEWLPLCDVQVGGIPARLWWQARRNMRRLTWNRPATRLWWQYVETRLKTGSCRFVVYSERARQAFLEDGVAPERIERVIIPTDIERFRPVEPELSKRNEILLIGSDPKRKGVDIALKAWPAIRKAHPGLTLNIVYNGRKVPSFAARFDQTDVTLSPLIPNPEAYFSRARILLAPSMFETWGNVVIEAAACGVPVITTQQTPASELISSQVMGTVFPRTGQLQRDAETLIRLTSEQLEGSLDIKSMHARHAHVQQFQDAHFNLVSWFCKL